MADELGRAQAAGDRPSRGEKREKKAYHAPWETTPAHCLDLDSGHSFVDEMSLEAFWKYLAKPANTVLWKSECPCHQGGGVVCPLLCGFAGDDKRVGVATSRLALTLDTAIGKLGSSGMLSWLDAKKFKLVTDELLHACFDPALHE